MSDADEKKKPKAKGKEADETEVVEAATTEVKPAAPESSLLRQTVAAATTAPAEPAAKPTKKQAKAKERLHRLKLLRRISL